LVANEILETFELELQGDSSTVGQNGFWVLLN
jgi:hypothetical protein